MSSSISDIIPNKQSALIQPRAGFTFMSHQEIGVRWMLERESAGAAVCRGGILGDDMGLGKTCQTIGLIKNSPLDLRTLIICPAPLIAGWTDELQACGFVVSVLLGSSVWSVEPEPMAQMVGETKAAKQTTIYLTSYAKACMYKKALATADPAFGRIILDEGHAIRNGHATRRWMSCMAIAKRATCRWILSATPVHNSPADWRNICWWLRVRCPASDIPGLAPVLMLRRTMDELRGAIEALPPSPRYIDHDLTLVPGSQEDKVFQVLCNQLESVIDDRAVSGLIKLELYMRIQQFLVHPQIYVEGMRKKLGRGAYPRADWVSEADGTGGGGATKWTACLAEIRRAVTDKVGVIVFCNFHAEMDKVADVASGMGASVFSIRGGMGSDRVGEAVIAAREACAAGSPVVVVVQIVSGGVGLNLQFCRRVLFLSQHWNPAVVHQAVGRAVRIGQRAVVEVHFFRVVDDVLENIDRRMVELHLTKIAGAQEICSSLYEGFAPLKEIPSSLSEDAQEDPC
jgi:SNF2 family DNA or RNA helicase